MIKTLNKADVDEAYLSVIKATYDTPIKTPMVFFIEIEPITLKFVWNHKRPPNSQSNLEKDEQSWRHHIPYFQIILQSYSNQNCIVLA